MERQRPLHGPSASLLVLLAGLAAWPHTGTAQDEPGEEAGNWSVKVGAGAFSAPDYTGSDELDTLLFPSIEATYKDVFFASVIDGVGVNLLRREPWGVTLSGQILMGRDSEGEIEGLESIDDRLVPKLEAFTAAGPVSLHASVMGDARRRSWEAGLQYIAQASARTVYMIGGGARWNDAAWNDERFSVSPAEAARIGVDPFEAEASLSEGYVEAALIHYPTPLYSVELALEVSELTGDAADSPIVRDLGTTTQPSILFRISRQL
jgi:outer membrane protein